MAGVTHCNLPDREVCQKIYKCRARQCTHRIKRLTPGKEVKAQRDTDTDNQHAQASIKVFLNVEIFMPARDTHLDHLVVDERLVCCYLQLRLAVGTRHA